MASIKDLRWGLAVVVAATIGCSSGSPTPGGCPLGTTLCNGFCTNTAVDGNNCGACGVVCSAGKSCQNAMCACPSGLTDCNGTCVNLSNDAAHCGTCTTACTGAANLCAGSACVASCPTGTQKCGNSCTNTSIDRLNCGTCGNACPTNATGCDAGKCIVPNGSGGGTSVGQGGATSVGGASNQGGATQNKGGATSVGGASNGGASSVGGASSGGATNKGGATSGGTAAGGAATGGATAQAGAISTGACSAQPDVISNFEDGAAASMSGAKVLPGVNITGAWEEFHNDAANGAVGTIATKIESSGGTADCDKWALHTTGTGWGGWVGIGLTNMAGTKAAPVVYPNTKNYAGVSFRAKKGSGTQGASAVRFNVSTPATEGTGSGGTCVAGATDETKCYNHVGRFLHQENELTTSWKTYTFCFNRDLYPLFLPNNLTPAQRDAISSQVLKLQFQFNKAKDLTKTNTATGATPEYASTDPFDFWLDDLKFITSCPESGFASEPSTVNKFPQSTNVGTCAKVPNAATMAGAIAQAYQRWTTTFVRADGSNLKVVAPEQDGVTTSEAMGYGMMIAAAMGDKNAFDKFHAYVNAHLEGTGLMDWTSGSSGGSATDGDEDIAYALLMADKQWGGPYKAAATTMINAIATKDLSGNRIKLGSDWDVGFNPSYFAPLAYRAFAPTNSVFSAVITDGYSRVGANIARPTAGLPTDWCDLSAACVEKSAAEVGAQVTGGFNKAVFGYDGARVPWRVGLDVCKSPTGGGSDMLGQIVTYLGGKYSRIDLMDAGIVKTTGAVATAASDGKGAAKMQASFIGSMGVAGMAKDKADMRDRAFRATLDILENREFNGTYFPATVGLLTVLAMSGNFPTP